MSEEWGAFLPGRVNNIPRCFNLHSNIADSKTNKILPGAVHSLNCGGVWSGGGGGAREGAARLD